MNSKALNTIKTLNTNMNTAEIKKIIQNQEEQRKNVLKHEKIIPRDIDINKLRGFLSYPNVLTILGIRRCGKSVLSWLVMKEKKCGYINFDDESLYGIQRKDLDKIIKAFYELYGKVDYFIFDEIQNISAWELFITRLRLTNKIIITGSNSQLLSGELATHLTGRHIDFTLFPFSFKEFCTYNNIEIKKDSEYTTETSALMEKTLRNYIMKGGFPEEYKYGKEIVKTIFGDIVLKDIVKRYRIKSEIIEGLAKYLITNFSSEISFNKLKNIFSIKKIQTIKNYIKYFENAYLIFVLERFSFKLKEHIISPKKIYCIDTGIINSISFDVMDNTGKLFENTVCTELFRRKSYLDKEIEIYYWKNAQQEEVDFVIKKGVKVIQLIQVCYNIDNVKTKQRELRGLLKASEDLKCRNLLVVTNDYEDYKQEEWAGIKRNVKFIPLWKWLLGF